MTYQWSPCASGAAYTYAVDWDGSGTYTDPGEDVTADLLGQGITVEYGRDQDRQLSPGAVGRSGFGLCNVSRTYSPENTSSPLFGDLGAARPTRFTASYAGTVYSLHNGRIDDFTVQADREERTVTFTSLDGMALLQKTDLSTPLYPGLRTGDLMNVILDAVGWTGGRDIDPGATIPPYWWAEDVKAFDAVQDLVRSEGPPAIAYVAPDGTFVFKDRHHRLLDTASRVSQAAFSSRRVACDSPSVTGFSYTAPFVYEHGWRDIVNSVTFPVDERVAGADFSVIWSTDTPFVIDTGQTVSFDIKSDDPFRDLVPTVGGEDLIGTGGTTVFITFSRSSGQSVHADLYVATGAAMITYFQVRARLVPIARTTQVKAEDAVSVAQHGRQTYPDSAPWAGVEDARAVASVILAHYAQRRPTVKVRISACDPSHLVQVLTRTVSDRVTIRNDEMGLTDFFHIESVSHDIRRIDPDKGPVHSVTLGCEKALTTASANFFTFDVAGKGFDDGYFGIAGLDDPASVFIFDHPTQGQFDSGLFGT